MKGMAHTRRCVAWLSRRDFLLRTSSAAAGLILGSRLGFACPQTRFARDPFSLGVASGYPRPDGFVLWTRLALDPLEGGGMPPKLVRVSWEVASDEKLTRVVRRGTAIASPDYAHAVHVELQGLEPDRPYWYRFRTGDTSSRVGRTRTAPAPGSAVDRIRFAFASCQQYEQGFFTAYRHMVSEELDVVIHLGDYIYESSWGTGHVRKHSAPEPITLEDYRARFALYRSDPDLQAAHAAFP
jgi:alkaline phosphatase D